MALQNGNIGEQQIAQRPQHALADPHRLPVSDNPYHESPFAQILRTALFPAAALQFWGEDFWEIATNAVAY
jgi:hypothetical protein